MGLFRQKGRCQDWSESNITASQRRAADRCAERDARRSSCSHPDVCVHTGLIFDTAHCTVCGKWVG